MHVTLTIFIDHNMSEDTNPKRVYVLVVCSLINYYSYYYTFFVSYTYTV